jgi:hypothetical protein
MSSRQNPLHLSNYHHHGYRFWGGYHFPVFCAIVAFGGGHIALQCFVHI